MTSPAFTRLYIGLIFLAAFLERTVFDLGPNVELATLAMLLASVHLSRSTALKFTLLLMAATDLVIGNTRIFIFTWSGFLLPVFVLSRLKIKNLKLKIIHTLFLGLASNFFFYLWTNFGVWLLDSWNMYPDTPAGLYASYAAGLPFLKLQLLSTALFVPAGFALLSWLSRYRWARILNPPVESCRRTDYNP